MGSLRSRGGEAGAVAVYLLPLFGRGRRKAIGGLIGFLRVRGRVGERDETRDYREHPQMSSTRVQMMCRMCMCRLPTGDGTGAAAPCGRDKAS